VRVAVGQISKRKNRKYIMRKSICFNGCSFTVGEGFKPTDRDDYVYDRLIANDLNLDRTNIAKGGSSNYLIFMRSASAILSGKYNIVVTQWSALNRLWLFPGPNTEFFVNREDNGYQYRDIYISKKEHKKLKEQLLILNHDYQNIIDVIDYCKILENLAVQNGVDCVFVNGLIPWNEDLFHYTENFNLANLSDYAKQILEFDYRNDTELIEFLKKLNNCFKTLNTDLWVNVFQSFKQISIDQGLLRHHPGIESNKIFAIMIKEFIVNRNLLEKA
jgi:hypothetical protein